MRRKVRRLKSLVVNRVDVVDKGSNYCHESGDGSHILISKMAPADGPSPTPMSAIEAAEAALLRGLVTAEIEKQLKLEEPMEGTIVIAKRSDAVCMLRQSSRGWGGDWTREVGEQIGMVLSPNEIFNVVHDEAAELVKIGKAADIPEGIEQVFSAHDRGHLRIAHQMSHKTMCGAHRQTE